MYRCLPSKPWTTATSSRSTGRRPINSVGATKNAAFPMQSEFRLELVRRGLCRARLGVARSRVTTATVVESMTRTLCSPWSWNVAASMLPFPKSFKNTAVLSPVWKAWSSIQRRASPRTQLTRSTGNSSLNSRSAKRRASLETRAAVAGASSSSMLSTRARRPRLAAPATPKGCRKCMTRFADWYERISLTRLPSSAAPITSRWNSRSQVNGEESLRRRRQERTPAKIGRKTTTHTMAPLEAQTPTPRAATPSGGSSRPRVDPSPITNAANTAVSTRFITCVLNG
mmetsp:Transcript_74901/g.199686  ORF Transcript_74901/g.199686 Transcript_74901/m.199686 type:complete len:285 (-) Transcript_74901:429-1283(-)